MLIYNISIFLFFTTLFQFISFNTKTLYSLSDLGNTNVFTKILLIVLFSMAGVPPFLGFFSKIFLFLLLFNSNFFILFVFFFTLLFTGLYFYIQNIRFLNSTNSSTFYFPSELNLRITPLFFYVSYPLLFFLLFGFFFTDDLFLLIS